MEDFMVYFTVFLGSPSCVRNAYLRQALRQGGQGREGKGPAQGA